MLTLADFLIQSNYFAKYVYLSNIITDSFNYRKQGRDELYSRCSVIKLEGLPTCNLKAIFHKAGGAVRSELMLWSLEEEPGIPFPLHTPASGTKLGDRAGLGEGALSSRHLVRSPRARSAFQQEIRGRIRY